MNQARVSRRAFLEGLAGAGVFAGMRAFAAPAGMFSKGKANLVFGIVTDIHVAQEIDKAGNLAFVKNHDTETFKAALRWFDGQGVDAVVLCGDMADRGLVSELQTVADAWFGVFPDDRAADGRKVVASPRPRTVARVLRVRMLHVEEGTPLRSCRSSAPPSRDCPSRTRARDRVRKSRKRPRRLAGVELLVPSATVLPGAPVRTVERIEPSTAEVVATLSSTCFAGAPLLTRQAQGRGVVYGLSVFPDRVGAKTLVKWCFGKVGLYASVEWPASVTVAMRGGRQVVVNCSDAAVETPVGKLEPFEVRLASSANDK